MSSKTPINKPHRAKLSTAQKGTLREPVEMYGTWAYWRQDSNGRFGWWSTA